MILGLMSGSFASYLLLELDTYAGDLDLYLQIGDRKYEGFLATYVILDLLIRVVLKRPEPKSHYYLFLTSNTKGISWQYLITSLFGIIPFMLLIPQLAVAMKAELWLGGNYALIVFVLMVSNHYLGLTLQFAGKRAKGICLGVISSFIVLTAGKIIPIEWAMNIVLNPVTACSAMIVALITAFVTVEAKLRRREVFAGKRSFSIFEILPTINFKNPLFQLEMALIVRKQKD